MSDATKQALDIIRYGMEGGRSVDMGIAFIVANAYLAQRLKAGNRYIVELQDDYCKDGKFVVVVASSEGILEEEWVFHTLDECQRFISAARDRKGKGLHE